MLLLFATLLAGGWALHHQWPGRRWPWWVLVGAAAFMATSFRGAGILAALLPWAVWFWGLVIDSARERMEADHGR